MQPNEYITPYVIDRENGTLNGEMFSSILAILHKSENLVKKEDKNNLTVKSIQQALRDLNRYGYYLYLDHSRQAGYNTIARFVVEDRREAGQTVIQGILTLTSNDVDDLHLFVLGQIQDKKKR